MGCEVESDLSNGDAEALIFRCVEDLGNLDEVFGGGLVGLAGVDTDGGEETALIEFAELDVAEAGFDIGGKEVHLGDTSSESLTKDLVLNFVEGGVGYIDSAIEEFEDLGDGVVQRTATDV